MTTITVKGMSCGHCQKAVTQAVESIKGTSHVKVNLDTGTAEFAETGTVDLEAVKTAIRDTGFEVP
ncbi:MAG: copper chaperone [Desulfovibrio sp.]|nr:MAG: copper chaperone [Desulfovibrio sp.]